MKQAVMILGALALLGCTAPTGDGERVEGRGSDTAQWYDALPRSDWAQYERVLTDQPWFEVYRIRPDTYAIYEPGQFEEVISFLIIGEARAVLFDTGLGIDNIKDVTDALTDRPITVINSHSHYDHIGSNHAFARVRGLDVPISVERAKGVAHDGVSDAVSPAWLGYKPLPTDFDPARYTIPPYVLTTDLENGSVIDLGGRQLTVFHLPGHAPDSLALYDANRQDIYVGDIFYLAPLYTHLDGSDFTQYQESARKLARLAPFLERVMTAHNVPIVDPEYLIKMSDGFKAIAAGSTDFTLTDGAREYDFDGFSILTFDPPVPNDK